MAQLLSQTKGELGGFGDVVDQQLVPAAQRRLAATGDDDRERRRHLVEGVAWSQADD
jgi:hypothetical protein